MTADGESAHRLGATDFARSLPNSPFRRLLHPRKLGSIGQLQYYFSGTLRLVAPPWKESHMEQSWTVDKYDVPSGDLEFWATRRGKMPVAANQNDHDFVPVNRRQRTGIGHNVRHRN